MWRVIFEAAVFRRIVRGSDHDAIGQPGLTAPIVGEDGVRDRRSRREIRFLRNHHIHCVRGERLHRAFESGAGKRVGVDPEEQRPIDPVRLAELANGLRDRENMPLVEGPRKRGSTVPRSAEGYPLAWNRSVRPFAEIRVDQPGNIDQHGRARRLAGHRMDTHQSAPVLYCPPEWTSPARSGCY